MAEVNKSILDEVKETADEFAPLYSAYAQAFNKLYHFQERLEDLKSDIAEAKEEALANIEKDDPEYDEVEEAYDDLADTLFRQLTGKTLDAAINITDTSEDEVDWD